jgi:hypothetical protein
MGVVGIPSDMPMSKIFVHFVGPFIEDQYIVDDEYREQIIYSA